MGGLLSAKEEAGWRRKPGGGNAGGGESPFTNLVAGKDGPLTLTRLDGAGQAERLVLSRPDIRVEDSSPAPD